MKEFVEKMLDSKYTPIVVMAIVAIILITVGYLIYIQYEESKDVDIYSASVDVYEDKNLGNNVQVKDDKPKNDENKNENQDKPEVKEKIELLDSFDIIIKGNNAGKSIKKDKSNGDVFNLVKAFLSNKEKASITTDTVVSLDISKLNDTTKKSIKSINAKVFGADGKVLFDSNIIQKYDKISFAVDELEKSEEYYAVVTIILNNNAVSEYVFKF